MDHSSDRYTLNKRDKEDYSKPNIIHPVTQTRTGKFGMPANYLHIAEIAALGNESCICYETYFMKWKIYTRHTGMNDSCSYKTINSSYAFKGGKEPVDDFLDVIKIQEKTKNDIRKKIKKQDKRNGIRDQRLLSKQNLYNNFLKNRQQLFENYIKTAQKLFRNYLEDAFYKIHKIQ